MSQGSDEQEHFAVVKVKKRFDVSFKDEIQQAMHLEVGDVLWVWPTKDGILLRKAPDNVQKLSKLPKGE